jgi:hypothetical protein
VSAPREYVVRVDTREAERGISAAQGAWLEMRAEAFRAQRLDWAGAGLVLGFLLGAAFVLIGGAP